MTERTLSGRQADDELECVESDEELEAYLETIVPYIGWIIVFFNSLEDSVSDYIREAILRDPIQDERLDVFLSEMMFTGKCRALMHLYGQLIESGSVTYTHDDLNELEKLLIECAKRRNEYAHADWTGVKKENYVRVKSQSKKRGVFHRYKKFEMPKLKDDVEYISNARHMLDDFNEKIHDQLWGRDPS